MDEHRFDNPREPRCRRSTAVVALALVAGGGCRSYEPSPLDLGAHRTAWHGRTLQAGSLTGFLERLGALGVDAGTDFDPADGLSLAEGRLVALVFHPELRQARLRVARQAASAGQAGRPADPRLSASVLRITESVSDRWILSPALTFTIPLSGRLAAERRHADANLRAAEGAVREAEWKVTVDLERLWRQWSAARLKAEETRRLLDALGPLVDTTARLVEQGELPRAEAALFQVESAQRSNQLLRLEGDAESARQALLAQLGLAPHTELDLRPFLDGSEALADAAALDRIAARNPSLARLRAEYDVAEEALRREVKKQIPDLTFGPQFETEEGQSRIGFLGGIPLPLLRANRRSIAEARAQRELARARFETRYETLAGRWGAANERARALARQGADFRTTLVPLVDRQLEDALELLRLGEGTSLVLLESLTRAHATKLEHIETRLAAALTRAEIERLMGPDAPDAPPQTP